MKRPENPSHSQLIPRGNCGIEKGIDNREIGHLWLVHYVEQEGVLPLLEVCVSCTPCLEDGIQHLTFSIQYFVNRSRKFPPLHYLKGRASRRAEVNAGLQQASIEGGLNLLLLGGHEAPSVAVPLLVALTWTRATQPTLRIIVVPLVTFKIIAATAVNLSALGGIQSWCDPRVSSGVRRVAIQSE